MARMLQGTRGLGRRRRFRFITTFLVPFLAFPFLGGCLLALLALLLLAVVVGGGFGRRRRVGSIERSVLLPVRMRAEVDEQFRDVH